MSVNRLALAAPLALALLLAASPGAFAAGETCPSGNDGACPGSEVCDTGVTPFVCVAGDDSGTGGTGTVQASGPCTNDDQCYGNLACIHGVCQYDPSLEDQGTAGPGGVCANNNECGGGQTCQIPAGQTSGTCVGATGPGGTGAGSSGFVPLAPIPGLTQGVTASQTGLASFLNNLYKYLIGIAAVLAVIEIIWGGIEIMGESVVKKGDGKARIQQAILGLVLVLSPVLVFTIINPAILNLSLNIPPLSIEGPSSGGSTATNTACTGPTCGTTDAEGQYTSNKFIACVKPDCSDAKTQCEKLYAGQTGGYTFSENVVCLKGGSIDPNGRTDSSLNHFSDYSCVSGDTLDVSCGLSGSGSGPGTGYTGH
jgi:hypothetical protein